MSDYVIVPSERTLGSAPVLDEWCFVALEGQEDVECWRATGHDGPHETIAGEPCTACGGLEMHTSSCPQPETMSGGDIFVQWERAR